jgi:hypothetical protein
MRKKKVVANGTEFLNKTGSFKAIIKMEVKSTNRNRKFKVELIRLADNETVNYIDIQICALRNGNFGLSTELYEDKRLHRKADKLYSNLKSKRNNAPAYRNMENKFTSIHDIYNFFIYFFNRYPNKYIQMIDNELQADNDILNYLLGTKKIYSRETVLMVTAKENGAIKAIINNKQMTEQQKRVALINKVKSMGYEQELKERNIIN